MKLCKWLTNSAELTEILREEFEFSAPQSTLAINEVFEHDEKTLEILWDPTNNEIMFNVDRIITKARRIGEGLTKRKLFSLTLTLYGPLEFVNLIILSAKRAMQISWLGNEKWDQIVNDSNNENWVEYFKGLEDLQLIQILRWTGIDVSEPSELHIFCDASEIGNWAVAYEKRRSTIAIIAVKSKVALIPKKAISILRLELRSNLLTTLLAQYIRDQHQKLIYGRITV